MTIYRNYTTAFILILIILLVLAALFRALTPREQTLPAIPAPSINSDAADVFTNTITLEKRYIEPEQTDSLTVTRVIARLTALPDMAKVLGATVPQTKFSYTDPKQKFTISTAGSNQLQYSLIPNGHADVSGFFVVEKNSALAAAQSFVDKTVKLKNIKILPEKADYFTAGPELEPVDPKEARIIRFPLVHTVEGAEFLIEDDLSAPSAIYVNSANKVIKATFTPLTLTSLGSYQVRSLTTEEALRNIENAIILGIQRGEQSRISSKELKTLVVSTVTIEYRLSIEDQQIIPMYHFIGTTTPEGRTLPVQVNFMLPAVQIIRQ